MTSTEQKVWKKGLQACKAPDPQQALIGWSRRYKVALTNETVVTVTRPVKGGRLSRPIVELANVRHTRTTVNGVVSPLGDYVAPGDAVAKKACSGHCKSEFDAKMRLTNEVLTVHCKFKRCSTKIINGQSTIICEYSCTGTAIDSPKF
jgi:hypothetical protein